MLVESSHVLQFTPRSGEQAPGRVCDVRLTFAFRVVCDVVVVVVKHTQTNEQKMTSRTNTQHTLRMMQTNMITNKYAVECTGETLNKTKTRPSAIPHSHRKLRLRMFVMRNWAYPPAVLGIDPFNGRWSRDGQMSHTIGALICPMAPQVFASHSDAAHCSDPNRNDESEHGGFEPCHDACTRRKSDGAHAAGRCGLAMRARGSSSSSDVAIHLNIYTLPLSSLSSSQQWTSF